MVNGNRQTRRRIWRKKQATTMGKENLRAKIIQSDNFINRDVHGVDDYDNDNNHK